MANTPAKTTKKSTGEKTPDIVIVGEIDTSDESFTATIFDGEEFRFSTDVNGFLLLTATRGGDEFIALMDSLVIVDTDAAATPKEIEAAREAEKKRFHDVLAGQKHLTVERLAAFVGDLMEIAGNEDGDS